MSGKGAAPARAPVVILACGNPSRGDDALGPHLLDRLQDWLLSEGLSDGFALLSDFQWQIEHALDLAGRRLALFIDADQRAAAPFVFRRVVPADTPACNPSTHAQAPETLLAVLARISTEEMPETYVLGVRGTRFALGDGLSAAAIDNAQAAFDLLQLLCRAPQAAAWSALRPGALSAGRPNPARSAACC